MRNIIRHFALLVLCVAGSCQAAMATDTYNEKPFVVFIGAGSEESPYLISDINGWRHFIYCIEKFEQCTKGKFFRLTSDIRLNGQILSDDGSTLTADTTKLERWQAIGHPDNSYHSFRGSFDGDGHTIYGLYINELASYYCGLFGYLPKEATVRNLNIADSYIRGTGQVGAICGQCDGQIINCTNRAMITSIGATHEAGGIAGYVSGSDATLLRCTNYGTITGITVPDKYGQAYNCTTGGVCGSISSAKVDSCANLGNVFAEEWGAAGGIAGSNSGSLRWSANYGYVSSNYKASLGGITGNNNNTVWGCSNEGQVVATEAGSDVGGIVGTSYFNSRIYESTNKADLTSTLADIRIGGIVGNMPGGREYNTYYTPAVYRSINYGAITTTDPSSMAGGISGKNYCAEIHDSENHGHIRSQSKAGGISPQCQYHSYITGCGNTGRIEALTDAGGIAGSITDEISHSWNSGHVSCSGGNNAGGIAGYISSSSATIRGCYNTGEVSDAIRCGGIVGNNSAISSVLTCYNAGYIHSDLDNARVGGLIGGSVSAKNCYNVGTVSANGTNGAAGGIAGNTWVNFDSHGNRSGSTITNCYNMGRILARGTTGKAGNISATYELSDAYLLFKNCYYLDGAIQGEDYIYNDTEHGQFTPLCTDDFKTLAERLNVNTDPWSYTGDAFLQGYGRPVLTDSQESYEIPLYFKVADNKGDSVLIDLGYPIDNSFFTTSSKGKVLDAYNVISDNSVRRVMLIDGEDYSLDTPVTALTLYYTRKTADSYGSLCLPFSIDSDDMPAGLTMMKPLQLNADKSILVSKTDAAQAGEPILFHLSENIAELTFTKQDVELATAPASSGPSMLRGVFKSHSDWTGNSFLPQDDAAVVCRAISSDVLAPFRAYLEIENVNEETLLLTDNNHTNVKETGASMISVTPGKRSFVINGANGLDVCVYDATGKPICNVHPNATQTIVPISHSGLYLIKINSLFKKVLVE